MNAIEVFEDWLETYLNFEHTPKKNIFWLDTIDFLCQRFDFPQDAAHSIHIAGSKGKGSVSRMISCILDEAGYKVGLYTSPHISDFRERISTPTEFFSEEIYENAIKELVPKIEEILPSQLPGERPLTWFEIVTLYAFLVFRQAKTDWNVFEVGLGGRLDSTNIIRPKICCLMPIELEHTEFLGDTVEKIAAEKAGIIKNCTPVIISKQNYDSVKKVFEEKAKEKHAPVFYVEDMISNLKFDYTKDGKMNVSFESPLFDRPVKTVLKLIGKMQAENAATAALTCKKILPNLSEETIEKGLSKAFLPGRFEIQDNIVLDGAHTINSIKLTLETFSRLFENKKANLLFACAADKDIKEISKLFAGHFEKCFVTRPGLTKQSNLQMEIECFKETDLNFEADADFEKMIKKAVSLSKSENTPLLITGSFYLLAEVKKIINQQ